jgi:hypothetical protein
VAAGVADGASRYMPLGRISGGMGLGGLAGGSGGGGSGSGGSGSGGADSEDAADLAVLEGAARKAGLVRAKQLVALNNLEAASSCARTLAETLRQEVRTAFEPGHSQRQLEAVVQVRRATNLYGIHKQAGRVCMYQATHSPSAVHSQCCQFALCNPRLELHNASSQDLASVADRFSAARDDAMATLATALRPKLRAAVTDLLGSAERPLSFGLTEAGYAAAATLRDEGCDWATALLDKVTTAGVRPLACDGPLSRALERSRSPPRPPCGQPSPSPRPQYDFVFFNFKKNVLFFKTCFPFFPR